MKVTALLKGMIDQNGQQPIQIRISDRGKRSFKPTGIKVTPEQFWKGQVKDHPKAKQYNETIKNLIITYQAQTLQGEVKKKTPRTDFFGYVESVKRTVKRKPGTLRQYSSQVNKLKSFAPTLYLSDITKEFLNQYRTHLEKKGNDNNTVWSSFKFIRGFVRRAHKEKLILEYPFSNYEFPKYDQVNKPYLTKKELQAIEKKILLKTTPPKLFEAGIWFLIASQTGLRISDIKAFDKQKNIISGRLVVKMEKGGDYVGLPILPKVKKYLSLVKYKPLSLHENTYNELLKVLAAVSGIDKKISSHTARHTAAMLLANAGVSQEVTAKVLGHRDLRATAHYYKITNQRIDMEIKKAMR
jgi:integrase/recombinase XerD